MNERLKETFRFSVLTAGYLPVANVWYIDGFLEHGKICPPVKATAKIEGEFISIFIKTVALVSIRKTKENRLTLAKNRFTLSIEKPPIEISNLIGIHITGEM